MHNSGISRRSLLRAAGVGAASAAFGLGATRGALAADLTVGIVYVGARDDFGWNQAHAVAAAALKKVPGVTVIEEENVPETDAVSKTMESMINLDGAGPDPGDVVRLLLAIRGRPGEEISQGRVPPRRAVVEQGQGSQERRFLFRVSQSGALRRRRRRRPVHQNRQDRLSSPPSRSPACSVQHQFSVLLGARSVNPKATVQVIFTGDWSMPVREAEAANALVDAGCDVITCHVDGPKVVIETAEKRGAMSCGHNANQAPLAPKGFITGAEYKWETIYKGYAADLTDGQAAAEFRPPAVMRSISCRTLRIGGGADARGRARKPRIEAIAGLKKGKPIYVGPAQGQQDRQGRDRQDLRRTSTRSWTRWTTCSRASSARRPSKGFPPPPFGGGPLEGRVAMAACSSRPPKHRGDGLAPQTSPTRGRRFHAALFAGKRHQTCQQAMSDSAAAEQTSHGSGGPDDHKFLVRRLHAPFPHEFRIYRHPDLFALDRRVGRRSRIFLLGDWQIPRSIFVELRLARRLRHRRSRSRTRCNALGAADPGTAF